MTARNDAPPRWRTSTHSGGNGGDCVEVAHPLDRLRDSKNPNGPMLAVDVTALVAAVRDGLLHA